jgi:hypothetical protein
MRTRFYIGCFLLMLMISCKDDNVNIFDKTADQRVAEAITNLKNALTAPEDGWRVKYKPETESGSYYVLLKFTDDGRLNIKTDLPADDGAYREDTITYRIDNSLGLELIFENYSFFAYLFEQDQATFGAEYEFIYVNATPDDDLVFQSKTDFGTPSVILFEQAGSNDENLLGPELAENLEEFNSSARIVYDNKDLAVYLSLNTLKRTADFNYIALKTNLAQGQPLDLATGYIIRNDSVVFDTPLTASFNGNNITIKSLLLTTLGEHTVNVCPSPTTEPTYAGKTSTNDNVTMETSLFNYKGASFKTAAQIYIADIVNIFDQDGNRVSDQITTDLPGAALMVVYNNAGGNFNAVGFLLENQDGTNSIAYREATVVYTGNIVEYTFDPDITIIHDPTPDAPDVSKIDIYLDKLTEGGKTYIYPYNESFYQMYNPCSGWRFFVQIIQ